MDGASEVRAADATDDAILETGTRRAAHARQLEEAPHNERACAARRARFGRPDYGLRNNRSTAARVGSAGWAPSFVQHSAPAALAKRRASPHCRPSPSATASAPVNASPAAVVSTTFTLN